VSSDVGNLGTVLGVWAHPDDETYLSGGLMVRAAAAGQRVVCVTATAGERGSDDPASMPAAHLAAIRRRELETALDILGVAEHHWLGHPDGSCGDVDAAEAAGPLASLVREIDPDTVLTFGCDGFTGHPDHVAVGRWARAAVHEAGSPARVLTPARTAAWIERFDPLHRRLDAFADGFPVPVDPAELVLDLRLDRTTLDRKVAALEAQPSQTRPVVEAVGRPRWRAWIARESFVELRAQP
jgi:LmbE family N-acetylglucosaminyl deacetylase